MIRSRIFAAVLLAALAGAAAIAYSGQAQSQNQGSPSARPRSPAAPTINRNLVVLDPAHGGPDAGATLGDHAFEKDILVAVAARLRTTLSAAGFAVIATRDADPANPLTTDQRAEIANRTHAVACIVLHATAIGSGVHVYTSALQPPLPDEVADPDSPSPFVPVPWETAQAGFVSQSLRLAADVSAALATGNLPAVVGRAPVRPLDNLMCPAVAIEVAPLVVAGGSTTPVSDTDYQQRVAGALSAALQTWRNHADLSAPHASATPEGGMKATSHLQEQAPAKGKAVAYPAGFATANTHAHPGVQSGAESLPTKDGRTGPPHPFPTTGADSAQKASQ